MTTLETPNSFDVPDVAHLGADDLPWVTVDQGVELKVLQVDLASGLWVIRNRFQPGVQIPTHRHTGVVHGVTLSGSWKYLEYDFVNTAGSLLFEPAGSVHTLSVPANNTEPTEVVFFINGANLDVTPDGEVTMIVDATLVLEFYLSLCEAEGHGRPAVVGMDA
jgi:2,4'-dihydroxyacetophenone dioxygenase